MIVSIKKQGYKFCNAVEIEQGKDNDLCLGELCLLKESETFMVNNLRSLNEEMECLTTCLKFRNEGKMDKAQGVHKLLYI
jgi:hypothetical protein